MTTLESLKSLQDELDILTLQIMEFSPKEVTDIFLDKVKELASTEILSQAMKMGDFIEPFQLKASYLPPSTKRDGGGVENSASRNNKKKKQKKMSKTKTMIRSSTLLEQGPLVITFVRGDWCPMCCATLQAFNRAVPHIQAKGANLIAIAPQRKPLLKSSSSSTKTSKTKGTYTNDDGDDDGLLQYPILYDKGNKVAKQFKISYIMDDETSTLFEELSGLDFTEISGVDDDDESYTLPLPATFVVNTNGEVVYSFVDCDPSKRAEPQDVIDAIPPLLKTNKRRRSSSSLLLLSPKKTIQTTFRNIYYKTCRRPPPTLPFSMTGGGTSNNRSRTLVVYFVQLLFPPKQDLKFKNVL